MAHVGPQRHEKKIYIYTSRERLSWTLVSVYLTFKNRASYI